MKLYNYFVFLVVIISGCTFTPPVSGFRPVSPKLEFGGFPQPELIWTPVDSLRPTLSWQPFPGEHQNFTGSAIVKFIDLNRAKISDIKYDLMIWAVRDNALGEVVYEIESLKAPIHTLTQSLNPSSNYLWSVRARFRVDGKLRLSEWSLAQMPCPPFYGLNCARGYARTNNQPPAANYFRFKTP